MSRRAPSSFFSARWAVWLFACALLLKAAVPLLASTSAAGQGKALVEVCTVYGVKTVALDGAPADDHAATHAGDHCALGAVVALAAPQPVGVVAFAVSAPGAAPPATAEDTATHDASAHWRARLKQGPPALA